MAVSPIWTKGWNLHLSFLQLLGKTFSIAWSQHWTIFLSSWIILFHTFVQLASFSMVNTDSGFFLGGEFWVKFLTTGQYWTNKEITLIRVIAFVIWNFSWVFTFSSCWYFRFIFSSFSLSQNRWNLELEIFINKQLKQIYSLLFKWNMEIWGRDDSPFQMTHSMRLSSRSPPLVQLLSETHFAPHRVASHQRQNLIGPPRPRTKEESESAPPIWAINESLRRISIRTKNFWIWKRSKIQKLLSERKRTKLANQKAVGKCDDL